MVETTTVLSIAKTMLVNVIGKAAAAAMAEMSLIMGLRNDIWFIKDELKTIQAFLQTPEVTKKKDELVKQWADQVRDLSFDIEDCLDEFMVHVGSQSLSKQLIKLKDRHQIAVKIRELKSKIEQVSCRNSRYNNLTGTETSSSIDEEADSYVEDIRNYSASNIEEEELVGFARPKKELIELMNIDATDGHAKVVCVVGTGGLGKTTLARKIYEDKEETMKTFHYRAWITVSQAFLKMELLKDMIMRLFGIGSLKKYMKELEGVMQVENLANKLREELKDKRYFIVFDDLWTIDSWNWIMNIAMPRSNNKASRIIVTTRNVSLAMHCTSETLIYNLEPLQIDDGIKLLLKKTNMRHEDMESDESFRNIITHLVKKCGCLPLAILTIGGVLATKKITEWENFYKILPSELESNPSLEAMRRMMTLSYDHLPSHLKPCFLYLSIFPEDYEIQRRLLVDRWVVEGFVKDMDRVTIKHVAESYFNELINRSMIQASRVGFQGKVKSCRIHDILHDIIVSISRKDNFIYTIKDNAAGIKMEKFRHVACCSSMRPTAADMHWSHVRSLTVFGDRPSPSPFPPELRMLRTLDLGDANFTVSQRDINTIGLLQHLKYVYINAGHGFEYSNIYSLPRSIGNAQGLQILDINGTHITSLPTEIGKLHNLRSLRCSKKRQYYYFDPCKQNKCLMHMLLLPLIFMPSFGVEKRAEVVAELHMGYRSFWSRSTGVGLPRGIGNLKDLQVLETVDIKRTSSKAIEEIGQLRLLRKLTVTTEGATFKKCDLLYLSIQKLTLLRSLHMGFDTNRPVVRWHFQSPPPLLRSLIVENFMGEMPDWFRNLTQLVKITFFGGYLMGGKTLEIPGALPNLMLLRFSMSTLQDDRLVFESGAFQSLRKLDLFFLNKMEEMRFEQGTSPQMESIGTIGCWFKSGIIGIKHLPKLKAISLGVESRVAGLGTLLEEVNAHPNHPSLSLQFEPRYHDLDDAAGPRLQHRMLPTNQRLWTHEVPTFVYEGTPVTEFSASTSSAQN